MNNRDHDELLSQATDRFERRLAEQCGKQRAETGQLRVDMIKGDADIRADLAKSNSEIRADLAKSNADIRAAVTDLRIDMTEQLGAMRIESATRHRELLKWALMLWVGQATALAGIITAVGYFFTRR